MKYGVLFLVAICPSIILGEVECIPDESPKIIFAGMPQQIKILFHNKSDKIAQVELRTRVFQVSSSTIMPVGKLELWKKLEVLTDQTIVEKFPITCPSIRVATRFQVQWADENGKIIGKSEVIAYPDDILKQLKSLTGDTPLGVWDPDGQLKSILQRFKIEMEDLAEGVEGFQGKLAILGPFLSKEAIPEGLSVKMRKLLEKRVGVVCLRPSDETISLPSVWHSGGGAVVIASPSMIKGLAESPLSQLHLIKLAEMAFGQDPLFFQPTENR